MIEEVTQHWRFLTFIESGLLRPHVKPTEVHLPGPVRRQQNATRAPTPAQGMTDTGCVAQVQMMLVTEAGHAMERGLYVRDRGGEALEGMQTRMTC